MSVYEPGPDGIDHRYRVLGTCEKCKEPIYAHETPVWRVIGWEKNRRQGGTNHILGRQRIETSMRHLTCIPYRRSKETDQQARDEWLALEGELYYS